MFYLETNAIIALSEKQIAIPTKSQHQCFTSIYTVQEIIKGIGKHLDEAKYITKRVNCIKLIKENNLLKDYDTINMKISSAFGMQLTNPFVDGLREIYNLICEGANFHSV